MDKKELGRRISFGKLKPIITEKELKYLYLELKLSSSEIAKRISANKTAIVKRLHLFNVPIRSNSEAQKIAQKQSSAVEKKRNKAKSNMRNPDYYDKYITNLRKVNVGRKPKPESIKKQQAKMIGRKRSPEHCQNLSKSLKQWARNNPDKLKIAHQAHLQMMSKTPKNFTDIEKLMATLLEEMNIAFVMQRVIKKDFIVDFYLPDNAIVVEADGDYWHQKPEQKKKDAAKDKYLAAIGLTILRFWGSEIKEKPESVKEKIKEAISYAKNA